MQIWNGLLKKSLKTNMIDSFGFFENKISRIKLKLSWINAYMQTFRE